MASGVGVKGLQFLPRKKISKDNSIESLQLLYDILGAQKLGRDGNDVYVCGVKLTGSESLSIAEILNRLKAELGDLTGEQGEDGQAATIEIGNTQTLAPGSQATVNNSGNETNAVLNFGIPQGAPGTPGPAGPAGTWVNGTIDNINAAIIIYSQNITYNNTQKICNVSVLFSANDWIPYGSTLFRVNPFPNNEINIFLGNNCTEINRLTIQYNGAVELLNVNDNLKPGLYPFSVSYKIP
jgi:hypothetical protein